MSYVNNMSYVNDTSYVNNTSIFVNHLNQIFCPQYIRI